MISLNKLSSRKSTTFEMQDFSQIEIDPVKRLKGIFVQLRKLSPTDPKYAELMDQGFRVMDAVCEQFFPHNPRSVFAGSVFLKSARVYAQIDHASPAITVLASQYMRAFEGFNRVRFESSSEDELKGPLMELAEAHTRFTSAIIQEKSTRDPQLFIRLKALMS